MSPLHHHFELSGWSEIQIVTRFWLIHGLGAWALIYIFYSGELKNSLERRHGYEGKQQDIAGKKITILGAGVSGKGLRY